MEKILLLGDTHGDPGAIRQAYIEAKQNDCIAIVQLGDFGYGWGFNSDGCVFSQLVSTQAVEHNIPLFWLDGNHENFDKLEELPLNENGFALEYMPGVTYLSRGSVAKFGDTTLMAFGGAYSVDKGSRIPHKSWWEQETCTEKDLEKAKAAGQVDIFLSHDAPYGAQDLEMLQHNLIVNWGTSAYPQSIANQKIVRKALDASGAKRAFHGHIHSVYERHLDSDPDKCLVRALSCNGMHGNTYILEV